MHALLLFVWKQFKLKYMFRACEKNNSVSKNRFASFVVVSNKKIVFKSTVLFRRMQNRTIIIYESYFVAQQNM